MSSNEEHLDDFEVAADEAATRVDVELPMEDSVSAATPLLGDGAGSSADYAAVKKDKQKKEKSGQKLVSDALKTDMASERTFFKWLWTGLHTGAIGTFIFVTFDSDKEDPYRLAVVAFAWSIAFALVLYGLFAYHRRRRALREGRLDLLPEITREWGPCIVVVALALVIMSGFLYAIFSGVPPHKGSKHHAFGALESADVDSAGGAGVLRAR